MPVWGGPMHEALFPSVLHMAAFSSERAMQNHAPISHHCLAQQYHQQYLVGIALQYSAC